MKFRFSYARPAVHLIAAIGLLSAPLMTGGCGSSSSGPLPSPFARRVVGETMTVSGSRVMTWAQIDGTNTVTEVGVTLPLSVIANPPAPTAPTRHAGHSHEGGEKAETTGPAGAFVVVDFPEEVKRTAYFDHFELHWNPAGHPPARYAAPHFDFHFYDIPVEEVRRITPPDPVAPAPDRIPAGYLYTGEIVPEMGVHAVNPAELAPGAPPFEISMILGYYNGRMNFLEPMITQEALLRKQPLSLAVPRPPVLGRVTRYPTRFNVTFDAAQNAYQCVYTDFVNVTQ